MVPMVGLEPTHLSAPDFESGASTNSTTRARVEEEDSLPHRGELNLKCQRSSTRLGRGRCLVHEKTKGAFRRPWVLSYGVTSMQV